MSGIGIPLPPDGEGEGEPLEPGGVSPAPTVVTPAPPPDTGVESPFPTPPPGGAGGKGPNVLLWIFILLLVLIAASLSQFFNWFMRNTLGKLWPAAGKPTVTPQSVTQALSSTLGKVALGLDPDAGTAFVNLAAIGSQMGDTFKHLGWVVHAEANALSRLTRSHEEAQATASTALQQAKQAKRQAVQTTQQQDDARKQTRQFEHITQQKAEALTEHIHRTIEPELDKLRHAIPELKKGQTSTWDELSKYIEAGGATAAIAATAYGLARLGGSWIRCDNNQEIGKQMCGSTGNSLAKLLEGGLPLLAFADMCAVLKGATALAESGAIQGSLSFGADAVAGLLSCTSSEKAPPLNSAYYAPGPLTALGAPGVLNV